MGFTRHLTLLHSNHTTDKQTLHHTSHHCRTTTQLTNRLYTTPHNTTGQLNKQRTISLTSHSSNILLHILQTCMNESELREGEMGSRAGGSTLDQVLNIQTIIKRARENNLQLKKNIYKLQQGIRFCTELKYMKHSCKAI